MVRNDDVGQIIALLRRIGNDTQDYEVKEAAHGVPKSLVETLSAFANGNGGTIILGVSEKNGFTPVDGFDARGMQEAVDAECGKLTPRVHPIISATPLDGHTILLVHVPGLPTADKPCYVTARGRYQGSYIRAGDGDRRLSEYEVNRLVEQHRQPTFDDDVIQDATVADLDSAMVRNFVERQRELHPRVFRNMDGDHILASLHVIRPDDAGTPHPTLGGLLALGTFPQQFLPRLNVTFTAFPGATKTETADDGRRFLDSQTIVGPIPLMIEDTMAAVARNMHMGAIIDGAFRKDVPDYPMPAVREAVANALMHRDYSPDARGTQVQVNMYADRLEILNPGGLFGAVTLGSLGMLGMSSTRNQHLSSILETTPYPDAGYVAENRGTGYMVIADELRRALMPPPIPRDSLAAFSLTFTKRRVASSEREPRRSSDIDGAILALLGAQGSAGSREIAESSGLSRAAVNVHLRRLVTDGRVERVEPDHSPRQRYRLAGQAS